MSYSLVKLMKEQIRSSGCYIATPAFVVVLVIYNLQVQQVGTFNMSIMYIDSLLFFFISNSVILVK